VESSASVEENGASDGKGSDVAEDGAEATVLPGSEPKAAKADGKPARKRAPRKNRSG
jgi:hypothetical protein